VHPSRIALLGLLCCGAFASPARAQMVPDPIFAGAFEAIDLPDTEGEAARFLTQASFGPNAAEVAKVRAQGYGAWIDAQFAIPTTPARPYLEDLSLQGANVNHSSRLDRWFHTAATGNDQLRQRMAFALSQVFVVSDRTGALNDDVFGTAEYWDMLARDAFGTYRTLLRDVTYSPQMGKFLTYLRNRKAEGTLSPDENYAREVMQLFSIGLQFRNMDFSPILDGNDQPVPTYQQDDVNAMARVFTGLSYPCLPAQGTACNPYTGLYSGTSGYAPMACFPRYHDVGPKTLLDLDPGPGVNRVTRPAGPTCPTSNSTDAATVAACQAYCIADIEAAIDLLGGHAGVVPFDGHPNVPPFLSRQLIQRFVASNPSPAYIERVATVFKASGGHLGQTLRALLLDPEARTPSDAPEAGKLREPLLRLVAMWRAWDAIIQPALPIANGGQVPMGITSPQDSYLQRPLGANSVFNFYEPDYQPPGPLADLEVYAPELQIVNESSVATASNSLYLFSWNSYKNGAAQSTTTSRPLLDLATLASLGSADAMVGEVNRRMLYGRMTLSMRQSLVKLLTTASPNGMASANATDRARALIDLVALSPEYAMQR